MSAGEARPSPPPQGGGPLLLAVTDDARLLEVVQRELENRYVHDYRVRCLPSAAEALAALEDSAVAGEQVALVLAGELRR